MKNILKLIVFLLLPNLSFAGTITNAKINISNNSKTYNIGAGNNKTINNTTTGKIYVKGGYIDIKKCYKLLNIHYNENKINITLIDDDYLKINKKTTKINNCLTTKNQNNK